MAEILAPAGSPESVYAAVRCGANAVYLAGEAFNARRGAKNFTTAQLQECVAYCHAHGVKVYHALNTLVQDSEIEALKAEIERILTLGEDALILQDLGVAEIVKSLAPDMPLHASTQLTAHSLAAVQALEARGFKRVVLAREMSREEIETIRRSTDVELEYFVHGALCMCVSGQCYMSAFFGARSGNRGLCAQPCRLPFAAPGGTGHDLSLKDNSLLHHLPDLEAMGIDSFKIEGRMKRPEYVAASVRACKHALAGTYSAGEEQNLKNIFSRQGFTDGYYTAHRGRQMFGSRTKEDVTGADSKLLKEYAALFHKETPLIACDMCVSIRKDAPPYMSMSALGKTAEVTADTLPEAAIHRALTKEDVSARITKLGGTQFYAANVSVDLEEGVMLSAGTLNALRRSCAMELDALLARQHPCICTGTMPPLTAKREIKKTKQTYLRFADIVQAQQINIHFDKIILPIEQAAQAVEAYGVEKLILETPRVFFGKEQTLIGQLEAAKQLGVRTISVGNIGALYLAKQRGFRIFAGLGTNLLNSYALAACGADEALLSVEMSTAQIAALRSGIPFGTITYGHIPLMITRNCPLRNGTDCSRCRHTGYITDRKGEKFAVRCRYGASEIFNPHALYMADRDSEIKSDFSLLYFTTESAEEAAHIAALCSQRATPDFKFTRGLYAKGVL
ncbi:MAG: U32 family peptidase [Clostridia bacterium]|nr:U32 family peptidase [Clostridia bacterium]